MENKEKSTHYAGVLICINVIFLMFMAITGEISISNITDQMDRVEEEQERKAAIAAERAAKKITDHELKKVPAYYQWDTRWKTKSYAYGTMEDSGCGPTCLSMVLMYFFGDEEMDPAWVADYSTKYGHVLGGKTAWTLMDQGAKKLGLNVKQIETNEEKMKSNLDKERVMICSMGPGDFTRAGHFIVITGYDEDGFLVRDPNSEYNGTISWSFERISGQIKNIWVYWL